MKFGVLCLCMVLVLSFSCREKGKREIGKEPEKGFAKNQPIDINYETLSLLLQDMRRFAQALKPLDREAVERIDGKYKGVHFVLQMKPLFTNVYPNPEESEIVFLIVPKDPATGAHSLLKFEKKLPVVDAETIEVQLRTPNPEEPIDCYLQVPDTAAYMSEIQSRLYTVRFHLYKRFKQAGTYDFDALTVPAYRVRGYPFVVFDVFKTELTDINAKLTTECR